MRRARAIAGLLLGLAATGGVLALLPLFQAWEALIWGTLLHLGLAVILVVLVFPFLWSHTRRSHGAVPPGTVNWGLLLFLTGIAISGGALVVIGQRGRLAALHSAFGIGFVVLLVRLCLSGKSRRALGAQYWRVAWSSSWHLCWGRPSPADPIGRAMQRRRSLLRRVCACAGHFRL